MKTTLDKAIRTLLAATFFCGMVWAAATKPEPTPSARLVFDTGLHDAGSVATNSTPVIRWTWDEIIKGDRLHIDARPKGSTNDADWVRHYDGLVTDGQWSGTIIDCVDKVVYVWSEYVPEPPVTTNGVYHVEGVTRPLGDPGEERWISVRMPIIDAEDGRTMSPPQPPRPINASETDEENAQ